MLYTQECDSDAVALLNSHRRTHTIIWFMELIARDTHFVRGQVLVPLAQDVVLRDSETIASDSI
jgi:hypothetical protein